jgi:hypothetical protein
MMKTEDNLTQTVLVNAEGKGLLFVLRAAEKESVKGVLTTHGIKISETSSSAA